MCIVDVRLGRRGREEIAGVLSWYPGCTTVKIKVGSDLHEDLARIEYVRELLPAAQLRIDVNGNWSVDYALTAINAIYEGGELEYVEQPCRTLDELRELKSRLHIPVLVAGDEVIRKSTDPLALDLQDAVDIVMLKVAPLGGIRASLEIAEKYGLPVVVSSALESAVGISYGLNLAAALPDLSNGFTVKKTVFSGKAFANITVNTSKKKITLKYSVFA